MNCGLLLAVLISGTARAATVGTLTQLPAPDGCISDVSVPLAGCATGRALLGVAPFFGSHAVALSNDGKNLYTATFNSDAIAVFDRSSSTGELTQKPGPAGCIVNTALAGCATGRAMLKPTSIAVSGDGKSVYAASIVGSAISVFDRNAKTGTLTQKTGPAGCISARPGNGCVLGRAMDGTDVVAVSPDGRSVYAGSFESNAVTVFDRNRSTGALEQKAGAAGCVTEAATTDCTTGRGLGGAEGLTISPDGKSVYVGAALGNAVAVFTRDRSTGSLIQPAGTKGCSAFMAAEGCANGDGVVGADAMQVSSDNKNLYVAAGVGDSVASYVRSTKTGHIRQLAGTAGCYTDHAHDLGRCNTGLELDGPEGIAVSPDGDSVYVGSFFSGAVAVFDRVSFTGTITQRTGVNGCIVNVATDGCTTGTALDSANALAISGDGRSVYVGAYGSNAVDVFGRAQPPPGHVAVSVPSRLNVPVGRVVSVPVSCTGSHGRMCPGGISLQPAPNGARTRGGSFNIPAGQRRNVSVALSASTLRYLSSNRSAKVTATLRVIEPTGRVKTFRRQMLLIESELG